MSFRKMAVTTFLLTLCLGMASCNRSSTLVGTHQITPVTLRLKWVFDPGFAGEMVAVKSGIFQKHGLVVSLKPGGFEADPIKLVATGTDTFGVAGADSFLLARSQGIPVVAIASGYLQSPVVFYTHQAADIRSPTDLKGKRIGVQAGQDTDTVFRAMLAHAGMTPAAVIEVPVKYDLLPFISRHIDVWPGYAATQSYTLSEQHIPFNVLEPSKFGVSYLGTVYFTSEKFLAEHPDVVQRFVSSVLEGWQATYANPTVATSMISSFDTKNLTTSYVSFALDKQKEYIVPEDRRFGEFTIDDWSKTKAELLQTHVLSSDIDLNAGVDFRFISKYYGISAGKH